MSTENAVSSFLRDFKLKMKIWDILFRDDRDKNMKCLAELELRPIERKKHLELLKVKDYSQGPVREKLYGESDMWIFGKMIKNREVYIKITMGPAGSSVICISFHLAAYKMNFPFKNKQQKA